MICLLASLTSKTKRRAEFVEIQYDERGFEVEKRYMDREGNPMPGSDDAYGQRAEYDAKGQLILLTSFNARGEPMDDAFGNATLQLRYNRDGDVVEGKAFDAKGEPTLVKGGLLPMGAEI